MFIFKQSNKIISEGKLSTLLWIVFLTSHFQVKIIFISWPFQDGVWIMCNMSSHEMCNNLYLLSKECIGIYIMIKISFNFNCLSKQYRFICEETFAICMRNAMVLCLCLLSIYSPTVKESIRFCAFQMNLNRLLQTYLHSLSGFRNTGGNILFIQRKNTIEFFVFLYAYSQCREQVCKCC